MKILFLGNFQSEFCSEVYYRRTFEKLGHQVVMAQEGLVDCQYLSQQLDGVDMFFWVHTHGWKTPDIEQFLSVCKASKIPTFAYHLDLYFGLKRQSMVQSNQFFKVDHFFTVDKLMADWMNENTQTRGHFMPAGVFEDDCYIAEKNLEKFPHEIVFTGAKHYHPEHPYRVELIEWLQKNYGEIFAHYGSGGLPQVRGTDLNVLYASAKVVIGDTLCVGFNYPWYTSDRVFECTGRGACLIYPQIRGLEKFFIDGEHLEFYQFGDFTTLANLIQTYTSDDSESEREQMKRRAMAHTKGHHTYTNRLKRIIEIVKPQ